MTRDHGETMVYLALLLDAGRQTFFFPSATIWGTAVADEPLASGAGAAAVVDELLGLVTGAAAVVDEPLDSGAGVAAIVDELLGSVAGVATVVNELLDSGAGAVVDKPLS